MDPNLQGLMIDDLVRGRRPLSLRDLPSTNATAVKFAAIGDSITGFNVVNTSSERSYSAYGFLSWAQVLLADRIRFSIDDCFGVSGDRIDQALARISSVLAARPDYCTVMLGTNDVAQSIALATMQTGMASIVDILLDRRITPVLFTILPRNGLTATQLSVMMNFNSWLRETYQNARDVLLIDAFRMWADPASSTSAALSGYTTDGVHPTQTGAYVLGKELADALGTLLPRRYGYWAGNADTHDITNNPRGNLLTNAGFVTTTTPGTGLTGTTGTSWTASRTAGSSTGQAIAVQNRTDGVPGKEIVLTVNVSGVGSTEEWKIRQGFNAGAASFSSGNTVYGMCEVEISSSTNLKWLFAYLDDNDGASVVNPSRCLSSASNSLPAPAWSGVLRTPPSVVKPYSGSGTQSLSFGIAVAVDGSSSGIVTVKFRAPAVRKVA